MPRRCAVNSRFALLLALAFLTAGLVQAATATHHWALDGNANDSIGSVTLQNNGSPQYVSGLLGQALHAQSSGLYDDSTDIARANDGSFFFSAWYKYGSGQSGVVVSYGDADADYHRVVFYPGGTNDPQGNFDFWNHSWYLNPGVVVNDGMWHNIVFSYNGTSHVAQAWLDDVSQGTMAIVFAMGASANFGIGVRDTDHHDLSDNSYIDDVFFGTTPVTQADVDSIWLGGNRGNRNPPPAPVILTHGFCSGPEAFGNLNSLLTSGNLVVDAFDYSMFTETNIDNLTIVSAII